ncbi:MAG: carbon-nitrogen hydrolase family protein [Armatimonadia bacterium]|nr:carbon-nitrogen hydrolase family protein [Armatimonadia bacterium]
MPKIAIAQILVETGRPDANLDRAMVALSQAAAKQADAVVLPECMDVGWLADDPQGRGRTVPGPYSEHLSLAARELGILVVAGLTERRRGAVHNSAVLFEGSGHIQGIHRKINVFAKYHLGLDHYVPGQSLTVYDTPIGKVGMTICSDSFEESHWITDALGSMGARVILSPCAWAIPPDADIAAPEHNASWKGWYSALAQRNGLWILAANSIGVLAEGVWKDHPVYGGSLAVSPAGEVVAEGPRGQEAVLVVDCPL